MAWLTNLVWPEQEDRRRLLEAAIEVTRAGPPRILPGDLLDLVAWGRVPLGQQRGLRIDVRITRTSRGNAAGSQNVPRTCTTTTTD